jgi:hypothetical protein
VSKKKFARPKKLAKKTRGEKACRRCGVAGGTLASGFRERGDRPGRTHAICRECEAAAERARREERVARLESDYASLKPEDFRVGVGNVGDKDEHADEEKKQEYSARMGEMLDALVQSGGDPALIPGHLGEYNARLGEQERRFMNRRLARTVSIHVAREELHVRMFKQACDEHLRGRVEPTGYARFKPDGFAAKRAALLLLSDIHLGAELLARDNPRPHGAIEEARAVEFVVRQLLDFKPQYREQTEAVVIFNGDLVEGKLQHSLFTGIPLVEQKLVFWRIFRVAIGLIAQQYKKVRVVFRPGNHGRDTVKHPGRATSDKWDGHEWEMGYALMCMCDGLKNVEWDLDLKPYAIVDLFGHKVLVSHGDTEPKTGDPDTKAKENAASLDRLNSTLEYGCAFDAAVFGHYHKGRYIPGRVKQLWNAALLPSNGHARTSGYVGEPLGQWLWEAVEGHPVGDVRFLEVTQSVLRDERLGRMIPPFRLGADGRGLAAPAVAP